MYDIRIKARPDILSLFAETPRAWGGVVAVPREFGRIAVQLVLDAGLVVA